METRFASITAISPRYPLRENHSGMETFFNGFAITTPIAGCVRTIVVWKRYRSKVARTILKPVA